MASNRVAVHPGMEAWRAALARTDSLFDCISPGATYERPVPERHRLIFYLGHVDAFDWNLLTRRGAGRPSFHPEFDKLFEFGIDPEPGCLPQDTAADWPSVQEVRDYVGRIRRELESILPIADEELVHTAVEHRLMHAETLSYLIHNLPYSLKNGPAPISTPQAVLSPNRYVEIPSGHATLGRKESEGFGWDNEFPQMVVDVPAFAIQLQKITNGEYLEYMQDTGAAAPHYWTADGESYRLRGMFGDQPLPHDHPVYVTHDEASAYAAWAGAELPTEPQWHRAALGTPEGSERQYPWGSAAPSAAHGNFDFHHWDTVSVQANPAGNSAFGVSQLVGNGWEWTSTPFAPFPGFQSRPYYAGYSANFFDNQHFVMKGGSPRTAAVFLRRSFRNWFRPNYPYVYATFRCVRSEA